MQFSPEHLHPDGVGKLVKVRLGPEPRVGMVTPHNRPIPRLAWLDLFARQAVIGHITKRYHYGWLMGVQGLLDVQIIGSDYAIQHPVWAPLHIIPDDPDEQFLEGALQPTARHCRH